MIAQVDGGFRIVGSKSTNSRLFGTLDEALLAMLSGATESCSDGACGAKVSAWQPQNNARKSDS